MTDAIDDAPEAPAKAETIADAIAGAAEAPQGAGSSAIDAMLNVGLNVQIVLGQTKMPIAQLLKLSRGSIIELDKAIGEPVEVVINDRLVARGDLVKLGDDRLGVSLIEIVKEHVSDV
ncbi:FliM/FliN family flagellar motor switch protein [Sagittula salina]|uniref:Flagellar motor switch protein FliN n=1 Tax=Sagittula salina TaxID=2820268 RepID=A0A940S1W3_9RHOB|nr:FliM/FliN family flagellar motor switch protein [Sagittula salina]MBP0484593.1 FliM/FliN family flagellar motor switch protein [Sagittula salina]